MINVFYAEEFLKDLKKLKANPSYPAIRKLCFEHIPALKSTTEITSLKKLKGFDTYYRIRKGDFRIGIKIDGLPLLFFVAFPEKTSTNIFLDSCRLIKPFLKLTS
jgi:mRNA interferase RelE/StbE